MLVEKLRKEKTAWLSRVKWLIALPRLRHDFFLWDRRGTRTDETSIGAPLERVDGFGLGSGARRRQRGYVTSGHRNHAAIGRTVETKKSTFCDRPCDAGVLIATSARRCGNDSERRRTVCERVCPTDVRNDAFIGRATRQIDVEATITASRAVEAWAWKLQGIECDESVLSRSERSLQGHVGRRSLAVNADGSHVGAQRDTCARTFRKDT
jgi:hypothetical protein